MPYANTVKTGLGFEGGRAVLPSSDVPESSEKFDVLHRVLVLLIATGAFWGLIGSLIWLDLKPVYYSLGTQIMLCLSGLSVGAVFGFLMAGLFDIVVLGRLDK